MSKRIVFITNDMVYRIVETEDFFYNIDDLKGDMYKMESGFPGTAEELRAEELAFEENVKSNGVFGYVLEKWNPEPNTGYEHVDSCHGFIGQYDSSCAEYAHDIVDEMKQTIKKGK